MLPSGGSVPPPSWYPDPWHPGQIRWWDGANWTPHATSGGWGAAPTYAVYPPPSTGTGWFGNIATLRFPAAIFGIGLMGIVLGGNFLVTATEHNDLASGLIALAALGFYAVGLPLGAWYASRTWGSGSFVRDLGFKFKPVDLALGVGGAVAMLITLIVVAIVLHGLGVSERSNLKDIAGGHRSTAVFIYLVAEAGVLAPFVEELLFRGVILRGLSSKLAMPAAIAASAVIFGIAHVSLDGGLGNIGLAVALACVGAELAVLARSTGRLGAGMIAHGLFNSVQIALLFYGGHH